jgi:hypothetical protein
MIAGFICATYDQHNKHTKYVFDLHLTDSWMTEKSALPQMNRSTWTVARESS